jgi:hypothetical protein
MRLRRASLCLAALIAAAVAGVAQASPHGRPKIPNGLYGALGSATGAGTSASVDLTVEGRGTRIRGGRLMNGGGYSGLSCQTGPSSVQGLAPGTPVSIHLLRPVAIKATGSFSFTGTITLTTEETQSTVGATTQFSLSGRFTRSKITRGHKVVVTGTVSASICGPATPTKFALVYD